MAEVPRRLVVIEAAIPEGETCDGCQFLEVEMGCAGGDIWEHWHCRLDGDDTAEWRNSHSFPVRLPACRARDGWTAYPPGSGVKELVEAAKAEVAAARVFYGICKAEPTIPHPVEGNMLSYAEKRRGLAARKVAEVGK